MSIAACISASRGAHGTTEGVFKQPAAVVDVGRPSPAPIVNSGTQGDKAASVPTVLDRTPVEVLVQVFQQLDLASAFGLAATNKRFASIFAANRASIVLSIVREEFSPVSGLLQVVKSSAVDLTYPWGTWLDKRVRRKNIVLCPGGTLPAHCPGHTAAMRITCAETSIDNSDIDRILAVCRVVKGWERVFPQHRFNASPTMTRSLNRRESFRLRRALYHWMRYAYYFHGDLPRPNLFVPSGRDIRINQLRALSNSELGELKDLWRTVEDIIELTICPSITNVRIGADFELSEKDAARIGWGEQRENRIVVATMSKLSPEELLHYMENGHNFTKLRLVQDIRQRHPQFEFDTESFTMAMSCVIHERWRRMQTQFPALTQPSSGALCLPVYTRLMGQCCGGILDWDDPETEAECARVGEMTGLGLDWRPEEPFYRSRPEIPTGLLNP